MKLSHIEPSVNVIDQRGWSLAKMVNQAVYEAQGTLDVSAFADLAVMAAIAVPFGLFLAFGLWIVTSGRG
jgi:hypothetical protein